MDFFLADQSGWQIPRNLSKETAMVEENVTLENNLLPPKIRNMLVDPREALRREESSAL